MSRDSAAAPDMTYIVSLCNRPAYLSVCLATLKMQTHSDFEVIITDNSTDPAFAREHKRMVVGLDDPRFRYVRTAGLIKVRDCYWAAEYAMESSNGKWLCFPCEDTYYPPEWGQRMLTAAVQGNLDLVLCENVVLGPESHGADRYFAVRLGSLSFPAYKTSFIVKAGKFEGWIAKPSSLAAAGVDRTTVQAMIRKSEKKTAKDKLRWGVARDLWYVHN